MIFFKNYRSKKQLVAENNSLKKELQAEHLFNFEEYFRKNTDITTVGGLGISFKGTDLVKIFASSFWDLVEDSENYIICDLYNPEGKSVEVIIKKKNKLSPQEKLKKVEDILKEVLFQSAGGAIWDKAKTYFDEQEVMHKKYEQKRF